jgi:hypothetical protein
VKGQNRSESIIDQVKKKLRRNQGTYVMKLTWRRKNVEDES